MCRIVLCDLETSPRPTVSPHRSCKHTPTRPLVADTVTSCTTFENLLQVCVWFTIGMFCLQLEHFTAATFTYYLLPTKDLIIVACIYLFIF